MRTLSHQDRLCYKSSSGEIANLEKGRAYSLYVKPFEKPMTKQMVFLQKSQAGLTIIEVMFALVIFVLACLVVINLTHTSVRSTKDTKEITVATWLLQNTMAELETKLESLGFDKGCDAKKEGKFSPPYDRFSWTTYCYEIDFNISQTAAQKMSAEKQNSETQEDVILKLLLDSASKYLSQSLREITAEVTWIEGKAKKKIDLTTQVAKYDVPFQVPTFGQTEQEGAESTSSVKSGGGNPP